MPIRCPGWGHDRTGYLSLTDVKRVTLGKVGRFLCALGCVVVLTYMISEISYLFGTPRGKVWPDPPADQPYPPRMPRVVFVDVQTRSSPGWCRMMLTSVVTEVPVITIGVGAQYSHTIRANWLLNFLEDEKLQDDDVLVMLDGADTVFTDKSIRERNIDHFIKMSPPLPENFSQTAIFRGESWPPMIQTAEPDCYAPQLFIAYNPVSESHWDRCARLYAGGLSSAKGYGAERLLGMPPPKRGHLNSGGIVGRVWAYKEAFNVYLKLRDISTEWWCDQSIWTALFVWSVGDAPRDKMQFVIRRGIFSLDYDQRYFYYPTHTYNTNVMVLHFTGRPYQWAEYLPRYFSRLRWFRNILLNNTYRMGLKSELLGTSLTMYSVDRVKSQVKYADVCDIEEAIDPDFLIGELPK